MLFYLRNAEIFAELNEIIIYIPTIVTSRKNTKRKKKKIYFESVRSHVARQASLMNVNDN